MSAEATVHRRRFPAFGEVTGNFAAVFADPRMMFGIKLGLAGLLAVYVSQLIRLGHANWALFTVLVLAPAQYVGAIAQRSIARVVGRSVEGFRGYGCSGIMNMIACSFWGSPSFTFGSACTCTAARSFRTHFFYVRTLS